jgi:hypothetical protein
MIHVQSCDFGASRVLPNSPTNRDTMSTLKLFCVIFKIKVVFLGKNSNIKLLGSIFRKK